MSNDKAIFRFKLSTLLIILSGKLLQIHLLYDKNTTASACFYIIETLKNNITDQKYF